MASQADLTDSNKSDSNTSTHDSSLSGRRKTRKSMPAKVNGSINQDSKSQRTASSSRASTPQSTKADRKSKSNSQQSALPSAIMSTTLAVSEATPTTSAPKLGKDKPVTPGPSRAFTPIKSSTRRTRKSVADLASQMHDQSAVSGDAMEIDSDSLATESSVKDSSRASRRPMSNTITLNVGRKALESVIPAALDTTETLYDHEIAESVEGTPVHVFEESYGDNSYFDYPSEMYGNKFGLDGQVDGPTSPNSFATSTSTGARTSARTRKPTIRAMESMESQCRFQRKRTRTPAAKEEPSTTGNDVEMPDVNGNAKSADAEIDQADTRQIKKRKKNATDDESISAPIATAHPTPAPSPSPARPASTTSSPIHSHAPAALAPTPYAPVPLTELSTERVDIVMRLISVADDVLVVHPDDEDVGDDDFLSGLRRAFEERHGISPMARRNPTPHGGNQTCEPAPCEASEPDSKAKTIKARLARARASKAKSRKAKARKPAKAPPIKPTKTTTPKEGALAGAKAQGEEQPNGTKSRRPQI